jgi:hypothetical protein
MTKHIDLPPDLVPAGFVVITFTPDKDETCPLDHCVVGAVRFDHQREAHDYVRSLDPDGIDQFPHVIPLSRFGVLHADGTYE